MQRNTYSIPSRKGHTERHDYEYERCGIFNVAIANELLAGGEDGGTKNK